MQDPLLQIAKLLAAFSMCTGGSSRGVQGWPVSDRL